MIDSQLVGQACPVSGVDEPDNKQQQFYKLAYRHEPHVQYKIKVADTPRKARFSQVYFIVYKCRMGLAPQYVCDMFTANNSNHSYNTKNVTQIRATITKTAYYYCSFTISD